MNFQALKNMMVNAGAESYTKISDTTIVFWRQAASLGASAFINAELDTNNNHWYLINPNWELVSSPQNGINQIGKL